MRNYHITLIVTILATSEAYSAELAGEEYKIRSRESYESHSLPIPQANMDDIVHRTFIVKRPGLSAPMQQNIPVAATDLLAPMTSPIRSRKPSTSARHDPRLPDLLEMLGINALRQEELQVGRDQTLSILGMPIGRRDGLSLAPLEGLSYGNSDMFGPIAVNDKYSELAEMRGANSDTIKVVDVDEKNMLRWTIMLYPDREPFNKGAFCVNIEFPAEYPFKPPRVVFMTKIYHPNVDEKGQVCLALITTENWKPATRTEQVCNALMTLINEPELDHPLRADLAEEYTKDKKKFFKTAEEYTKKHGEKRSD